MLWPLAAGLPACQSAPVEDTETSGTTEAAIVPDCIRNSGLCFVPTAFPEIINPLAAYGGALSLHGKQEVLIVDALPDDLWRIAAAPDGTFEASTQVIQASTVLAGDLNGDGDDELLVYQYSAP